MKRVILLLIFVAFGACDPIAGADWNPYAPTGTSESLRNPQQVEYPKGP